MSETAEQFVQWLLSACDDYEQRRDLTLTKIYNRASKVELGPSLKADAITEHEKYTNLIDAGFTASQAFQYLLNERAAIMSAAVTEGIRQQGRANGNEG